MSAPSTVDRRAWDLLERCLEVEEGDRLRLLAQHAESDAEVARRVRRLLRHDAAGDNFLEQSVVELVSKPPEAVGPYRLEQRLGIGGNGAVYRARRISGQPSYPVAVKLLWSRQDEAATIADRGERALLGALDHPGICRMLETGTTAGRSWIAMELVEGESIDRYCERHGASLQRRIALLLEVLAAVEYAHSMQVIHCDIKPSNVLVDAHGKAKLLDFGIGGRLRAGATHDVAAAFTPGYSSPEQLRGVRLGPAADVFALGALLYQLLCGRPPFDLGGGRRHTMEHIEARPLPPSELLATLPQRQRPVSARKVRGRLDAIVARALAPRPEERYAGATRLAQDLERFRSHRPVSAHRVGLLGRWKLTLRRHRIAATAAMLVVATALALGWQSWRLLEERHHREAEQQRAASANALLFELLADLDPAAGPATELSARELIDRARRHVAARELDPQTRAEVLISLGSLYGGVGAYEPAIELLEEGLLLRPDDRRALTTLAVAKVRAGSYDEGEALARRAMAVDGGGAPDLGALTTLAWAVLRNSRNEDARLAEADRLAAEALALANQRSTPPVELGRIERLRASVLHQSGRSEEALPLARDALARLEDAPAPPYELALARNEVALVEQKLGRFADAARELRAVAAALEKILGRDHPEVAGAYNNLALALSRSGELEAATRVFEDALERYERALGAAHPMVLSCASGAAKTLQDHGELERAEALHRRVAIGLEAELGKEHVFIPLAWALLAENLALQGRCAEAGATLRRGAPSRDGDDSTWMTATVGGITAFVAGCEAASPAIEQRLVASQHRLEERLGPHADPVADARARLERYRERWSG